MSTIYRPLQTEKAEIRLLEFVPDDDREKLCFRLHHISLHNAPKFWAISYTWGEPRDKKPIFIGDHTVWVRANLWRILRDRLSILKWSRRKPRGILDMESPNIWVDAICINQSDFEERSKQVQLMGMIYRKGMVAVCLDKGDWETDRNAVKTLLQVRHDIEAKEDVTVSDSSWAALYEFFTKGWFTRMWVIQEFIIPKTNSCHIWLNNYMLDSFGLWTAAHGLFQMNPTCLNVPQRILMRNSMKQYLSLFEIKLEQRRRKNCDPEFATTLLWIFRDRFATDPRDKIYSLLGILETACDPADNSYNGTDHDAGGSMKHNLIIDYHAPTEDVYASLVDFVVSGTQSLNIICASQHPSSFTRSWVPNWAEPWQTHSFLSPSIYKSYQRLHADYEEVYHASGSRPAIFSFSHDRASLSVQGIRCDQVLCLYDTPPFPMEYPQGVDRWAYETFHGLSTDVQKRLENTYGQTDMVGEFLVAIVGGPFDRARNRGKDYRGYYGGASRQWHEYAASLQTGEKIDDEIPDGDAGELDIRSHRVGHRRKIFIGEKGYCGLVPDSADIGDDLCVLFGCDIPVLLREMGGNKYRLLGESYVQGLMDGEVIEKLENGKVISAEFILV
ncbi:hypothetical protein CONLIGDRAFT_673434 [Coniochaeta ligniaria NRRL 30616]|uniref:Heterokaryon incompatibility domain-containing protein n=1 Tax=Coniochaeta ligniaria NRRL 30616 TaxID=1408157 RepID=A0A1J7IW46_9PEZI|nr:hypothetical protein CONLIGDRAFT_673434 [Coniochaeta ligniaria NRRL 30616]